MPDQPEHKHELCKPEHRHPEHKPAPHKPEHKPEPHKPEPHKPDHKPAPHKPEHKPAPHHPQPHHKMSDDQNRAVQIHNQARMEVFHNPLQWDDELARHAQDYANKLAAENRGLNHSSGDERPNQGENLYWSKPNGSLGDASQGWVDEKPNYHGENIGDGDFASYGHYTQCIWPSTEKVGIAMAQAGDGGWFVVGRYSPPGNWSGKNAING
ncbi:MAG: hypothetical protein Q9214_003223 [Letrouitia sp. 1 TL-2023]